MKVQIDAEMAYRLTLLCYGVITDFTFEGSPCTIQSSFNEHFTMEDNTEVIALETRLAEWNYNFS